MPEVNTFSCAICGALKREVNRWWILRALPGCLDIREFNTDAWETFRKAGENIEVACGEEHGQQLAARWMVAKSFAPPSRLPLNAGGEPGTEDSSDTGAADSPDKSHLPRMTHDTEPPPLTEIEALNKDLAAAWGREKDLQGELTRLRGVVEQYQRFTGGANVESDASAPSKA